MYCDLVKLKLLSVKASTAFLLLCLCQSGYESGDVVEGLLECISTSGRFRTVSTSSVSFAVPSLGSCDIFPEIAGVVSASDSETDVAECLLRGQDCLHAGDSVLSPSWRKYRWNSTEQSSCLGDASFKEMLDTLCFSTHDLTHVNNVLQNVVLDWQSGAAVDNCLTANEVIVKTEPLCENIDINSDDSLVNGYITTTSEGTCICSQ